MTATTPPLAALTTVFTPPCPITWLLTTTKVPSQYPSFATGAPASCDPPAWDEYIPQRGFEYYSPAICPDGFYVGPSCIVTNPRTAQGFPAIQGGETAAYCIPNGHTCTSDTSDFRGGVWGVSRTATVNGAQVTVGPAIQIRWRDEDLENMETDPLTPGPRTTQPVSTEPPPEPTSVLTSAEIETPTPDPTTTSTQRPSSSTTTSSISRLIPGFNTITLTSASTLISVTSTSSPLSSPSLSSAPPKPSTSGQDGQPIQPIQPSQPSQPSQSSTIPTASKSGQQQGGGDRDSRDSSPSDSSSHFTVAAIVLTAILITIIVAYAAYSTLQRYRRFRAGETATFFVFEAEAWVRRQLRLDRGRRGSKASGATEDEKAGDERDRRKIPDAELGTDGPLTELGSAQPFGTKENPAELPSSERWSWRSRVSRILTVRTRQGSLASGS
ncbi:hypothetical protein GQX73_g6548 [Xylaria multiplex]|uniref:Uncharacterized protein n=1 Tax=Xylaria multiplex TaxID=323545 RepID=A0A7C8IUY3_9PEZI|nr:hypothetical protein GQX73_g6548 [Xylaria multiplex]